MPKTPEQWLEEASPQNNQGILKLFSGIRPWCRQNVQHAERGHSQKEPGRRRRDWRGGDARAQRRSPSWRRSWRRCRAA